MMRCMRTVWSRTDNWAAHAGPGFLLAGPLKGSEADSRITAAQRAIDTLITLLVGKVRQDARHADMEQPQFHFRYARGERLRSPRHLLAISLETRRTGP